MTIGKQDVLTALSELRVNRPRQAADQHIRTILRTYGNGATHVSELSPDFYESVWRAAGGSVSFEEFYGVSLDVQAAPTEKNSAVVGRSVPGEQTQPAPPPPPVSTRPLTPLVADLERKLAERAGKPRSRPTGRVSLGNPAQSGDEDAPRQYPSDGWRMS